ncbi:MAG: DUF58 domain-containing protein [Myxococcaceae bacterium]
MGRPVPTTRALWLAAFTLVPAALAMLSPRVAPALWVFDGVILCLVAWDFLVSPRAGVVRVTRETADIWSAGRPNVVRLELTLDPSARGPVRGEVRDHVDAHVRADGLQQRFELTGVTRVEWRATPPSRGAVALGPVTLRLLGPLGLCARQVRVELPRALRVFPDLAILSHDALTVARAQDDASKRTPRIKADGREFDSLRDYRPGDDRRTLDWKATARRGKPMVRQYRPERNQQVVVLLDCGRHMAGELEGRRKLDHAVDAALRLARVALGQGDLVGLAAYGAQVQAWLPPRKGLEHLALLTRTLATVEARLEESSVGAALDQAFARGAKRSLVVILTDLLDPDAAQALAARVRRLVPRHLPMIVSLQDEAMHALAHGTPEDVEGAYQRVIASRLERDGAATVARLREGGARVVRGPPSSFASAGVDAYLDVKQRGLL